MAAFDEYFDGTKSLRKDLNNLARSLSPKPKRYPKGWKKEYSKAEDALDEIVKYNFNRNFDDYLPPSKPLNRQPTWKTRQKSAGSIISQQPRKAKIYLSQHITPNQKRIQSQPNKPVRPYQNKDVKKYLNTLTPRRPYKKYDPILDDFSPERKNSITEKLLQKVRTRHRVYNQKNETQLSPRRAIQFDASKATSNFRQTKRQKKRLNLGKIVIKQNKTTMSLESSAEQITKSFQESELGATQLTEPDLGAKQLTLEQTQTDQKNK